MCVTVLASQPSASIATLSTQRMFSTSRPALPTVFMISRNRSFVAQRCSRRAYGVSTVYDLSATPFFLGGSGYRDNLILPWVVSDFSFMDAIEREFAGHDHDCSS